MRVRQNCIIAFVRFLGWMVTCLTDRTFVRKVNISESTEQDSVIVSNPQTKQHTTQETQLNFLLGDWHNTGHVEPGSFGPGGDVTGKTTYWWDVMESWFMYKSRLNLPGLGVYEVQGGVSWDAKVGGYKAYSINNMGNLLVYSGEWEDENTLAFTLVHPDGDSRVVYIKQADGTVIMQSERGDGDGSYEIYFATTLRR